MPEEYIKEELDNIKKVSHYHIMDIALDLSEKQIFLIGIFY